MSMVRYLEPMKTFFVRTSEEDINRALIYQEKRNNLTQIKSPSAGPQGPVSGQSRISETGTTAPSIRD